MRTSVFKQKATGLQWAYDMEWKYFLSSYIETCIAARPEDSLTFTDAAMFIAELGFCKSYEESEEEESTRRRCSGCRGGRASISLSNSTAVAPALCLHLRTTSAKVE